MTYITVDQRNQEMSLVSTKKYNYGVDTHQNRLFKALLMRSYNICFVEEDKNSMLLFKKWLIL